MTDDSKQELIPPGPPNPLEPIKFFVCIKFLKFTDGTAQIEEMARGSERICNHMKESIAIIEYFGPKTIWESKVALIEAEKFDKWWKEKGNKE